MELKTPTKNVKEAIEPFVIDDKRLPQSPSSSSDHEEEKLIIKKSEESHDNLHGFVRKYVGDVDLPEGKLHHVLPARLLNVFHVQSKSHCLLSRSAVLYSSLFSIMRCVHTINDPLFMRH